MPGWSSGEVCRLVIAPRRIVSTGTSVIWLVIWLVDWSDSGEHAPRPNDSRSAPPRGPPGPWRTPITDNERMSTSTTPGHTAGHTAGKTAVVTGASSGIGAA